MKCNLQINCDTECHKIKQIFDYKKFLGKNRNMQSNSLNITSGYV